MSSLTRRELIRLLGGVAALAYVPACGDDADPVFSADELAMLRGFANVIIPPDDTPGGADLGAIAYIEQLIRAFEQPTPRIFAGGPFSGRAGGDAEFANFIELDRVSDAAWRDFAGEIKVRLKAGLGEAIASGSADHQKLFDGGAEDFRDLVIDLVSEAAWGAPEYGGNPELAGWKVIHFEGDSQPRGYTQFDGSAHVERPESPFSTANPSDPEPLTADVQDVLRLVVAVLGGRVTP